MAHDSDDRIGNTISGGVFFSTVIQGRDITVILPPRVTPAMAGMPMPSLTFTGRGRDLDRLLQVLAPVHIQQGAAGDGTGAGMARQRAVMVTAVGGMAGIGKTELALQAARTALDRGWFPGGVLFVDMFGYDSDRNLTAAQAAAGFVRALGIPGEHIPADIQDLERLFRSVVDAYTAEGRAVLVIIDNVSDQARVLPLLPAHPACRAIVTSRHTLAGLNARLVDLDTLPVEQAVDLLEAALTLRIPDDARIRDYPDDVRRVAGLCGGLPLALQIVAALLATIPDKSLAAIAGELADAATRLEEMTYADRAVQAVFDTSYRQLGSAEARLFRLLSVNPGPDISAAAAAALADLDKATTRRSLEVLARAHLIERDSSNGRWRMHDLIRLHSAHHGRTAASADQRDQALARLLEHYLATAYAAGAHLGPINTDPATPRSLSREQALAWLDAEYPNLTAATSTAATDPDRQATARDLPDEMSGFMPWRQYFRDWITLSKTALAAAEALHDPAGPGNRAQHPRKRPREQQADVVALHQRVQVALNTLGNTLQELGSTAEAIVFCGNIAQTFHDAGNHHGEGAALINVGNLHRKAGRFDEAITAYRTAARIFHDIGDQENEKIARSNIRATQRNHRGGRSTSRRQQ